MKFRDLGSLLQKVQHVEKKHSGNQEKAQRLCKKCNVCGKSATKWPIIQFFEGKLVFLLERLRARCFEDANECILGLWEPLYLEKCHYITLGSTFPLLTLTLHFSLSLISELDHWISYFWLTNNDWLFETLAYLLMELWVWSYLEFWEFITK